MKTRIFKLGMPLVAFLLAIVFAFASDAQPDKADDAFVTGYIFLNPEDGCMPVPKDCNNIGEIPCTYFGQQVYEFDNKTYCSNALTHRPW